MNTHDVYGKALYTVGVGGPACRYSSSPLFEPKADGYTPTGTVDELLATGEELVEARAGHQPRVWHL